MDYSFIKGVRYIDENTIEFDTKIYKRTTKPKLFRKSKDTNVTHLIYWGKDIPIPVDIYVNGKKLEWVNSLRMKPEVLSIDDTNYKRTFFTLVVKFTPENLRNLKIDLKCHSRNGEWI